MRNFFAATFLMLLLLALTLCACANNETPETSEVTSVPTEAPTEVPTEEPTEAPTETPEDWALSSWDGKLISPQGVTFEVPVVSTILFSDESRCLLFVDYTSIWLADATTGEIFSLSGDQTVIDYNIAYDTVYWFTLGRDVWASDWQSDDYSAYLFCEEAIAVSQFDDKCEGAIVEPERANRQGYAGLPIYSPYGIEK